MTGGFPVRYADSKTRKYPPPFALFYIKNTHMRAHKHTYAHIHVCMRVRVRVSGVVTSREWNELQLCSLLVTSIKLFYRA